MKIRIKPIDLLFFGNSRPFENGIDTWAESLMIPNYSTIYGALRALYITAHPDQFHLLNTDQDPTSGFMIEKVSYLYQNVEYYPAPADLVLDEKIEEKKNLIQKAENYYESYPLIRKKMDNKWNSLNHQFGFEQVYAAPDSIQAISLSNAYISTKNCLPQYACGGKKVGVISLDRCIEKERHVGLALDDYRRSAAESKLYSKIRMKYTDLEILVDFKDKNRENIPDIPSEGIIKIGGYGNIASYKVWKEKKSRFSKEKPWEMRTDTVKLYLQAPSIFENGWIPDFLSESSEAVHRYTGDIEISGEKYRAGLLTACIPGYQNIGGFDMKNQAEKAFYKAVPAGSIYVLKLDREVKLNSKLTEIRLQSKLSEEGFGLTYIMGEKMEV